jgi:glutathione S-transferase
MITIWGRVSSLNVQKVLWLLGELDVAHEQISAGGSVGGLNTQEFLLMNPHGRIPVLKDKAVVVWESHAILRYVAAQYGSGRFWSDNAGDRAQVEQWMDWSQTTLQPDFLTGVFWGFYRTPEAQRNWLAINARLKRVVQHFQMLDGMLKNQLFLGGETISLADIPAGALLYRYYEIEIERPALPYLEAWYMRLQERPAYQQYVMVPFAEMKGKLSF